MDNFRALPKLNEKLEDLLRGTQARIAKVVGVYGSEVEVEMTGGAKARYATTQTSVPIGQPGIVISGFGDTGIFIPLHMSNPLGKHWYDRGDGIQVGSVNPSVIDPAASSFVAIGSEPTITGSESVAIGIGASSGWRGIAIGSEAVNDGGHSIAIGRATVSTGSSASIAIGHFAEATTDFSIAQGYQARASSSHAIAIGFLAKGTAGYAVAIGPGADAGYGTGNQYGEVAIGRSASAKYARGVAIGHGATALQHYDGVIAVNTLRIEPQNRVYSKLGLRRFDGTQVYLYINNSNEIIVNTSW